MSCKRCEDLERYMETRQVMVNNRLAEVSQDLLPPQRGERGVKVLTKEARDKLSNEYTTLSFESTHLSSLLSALRGEMGYQKKKGNKPGIFHKLKQHKWTCRDKNCKGCR